MSADNEYEKVNKNKKEEENPGKVKLVYGISDRPPIGQAIVFALQ